jgi:hypothetical protein
MNKKGVISTVDTIKFTARAVIPELDNLITGELSIADHIEEISPGENVIIAFYTGSMDDGAIIAKLR